MSRFMHALFISPLALLAASSALASCGATFCTLSSDWRAQGVWNEPGWQADLRYEFIDQDRPRAGSKRVAVGAVSRHDDEIRTLNNNVLLNLDYNFGDGWSLGLHLPWVSRQHDHIHNHHGDRELEQWDIKQLGDARINLRLPLVKDSGFSLSLGVKLPTGSTNENNDAGERAERTLQPGTGSTDTILGIHYHSRPGASAFTWFAQAGWQNAITSRDNYKPGDRYNLDLGGRYAFTKDFSGIVQANFQSRDRDSGANAEPEDTGGQVLYISPGIAYDVGAHTQIYGFVQLPAYTYANGVQVTAGTSFSVGISHRF